MTQSRTILCAMLALTWTASPALSLALEMPFDAVPSADKAESLTSYALPVGAYANGAVPSRMIEGPLIETAWRIDAPGVTTLELLQPLRQQVLDAGFTPVFECEAARCGGFDFRYGTRILPEPEMHVDLGDYRYFAAERGTEVVSLIVSRTAAAGFVQVIHVGGAARTVPLLSASTMARPAVAAPPPQTTAPAPMSAPATAEPLGARLLRGGAVALEDLVFASGAAALAAGEYGSLRDLAAWLRENPGMTVALVGHTDASGGLEGNIALSRKRADAVRQYLIGQEGIPAAQVEAQGVGYLSPRASNLDEAGREKNRRVEVMVTSTQVAP
ncbi:OmpA family protein [Pseudorhodobacter sp. MZDSW-24AT]|uniref:OmpA family protein n=1 Tax=Pseudorhodobacter sp. MZDSW-24AT TaxID=2052957 RepID=UPI00269CC58D|nr:OmpA family protein [Pseudorhodobacter sp. MZDSW-24AT]